MRQTMRITALCLLLALLAGLVLGCGKPEEADKAVKQAEAAIAAIETAGSDKAAAVEAARTAYEALSEADRAKVENYADLTAAQYELDRQELIDLMGTINSSVLAVAYGEYLIMDNVGASQFAAYHMAVRDFTEDKPLSEYEGDQEYLQMDLWAAGYGICPENLDGTEIRPGRELAVIHTCVVYNVEYDRVARVEELRPMADAFFEQYGTDTEELQNLKGWYDTLSECADVVLEPSGTVNDFLQSVLDHSRAAETYWTALGVDLDSYKTQDS